MKSIFSRSDKKMNKLSLLSLSIVGAILLTSSPTTHAESNAGGRTSAIFDVYYDASVASFGYQTNFGNAFSNWEGHTSKVNLTRVFSTTSYPDKYYVGNSATPGLLGLSSYFNLVSGSIVQVSPTDSRLYSTVSVYENNMDDPYGNGSYSMTDSERTSNMTHEIGHTLSQKHPSTSVSSVMNQGIQGIGPTFYDAQSLIAKWGS